MTHETWDMRHATRGIPNLSPVPCCLSLAPPARPYAQTAPKNGFSASTSLISMVPSGKMS